MEARNRCGLCKKEASVTKTPGPASLQMIKTFQPNYKGAPLCNTCFNTAKSRVALSAQKKSNRENQTPNTSSSGSLGAVNRPETEPTSADSRTERGDSLLAQKGTQATKSFSQPIGSRETSRDDEVPPFLPENAQQMVSLITQELAQEPSTSESLEIPAQLEVFTPPPDDRIQEEGRKRTPERVASPVPTRKRPRVELTDIEESEEREEDAPPEEVVQQIIGERETEVPAVDVEEAEDVQEAEISVASSTSSGAPLPRNPRIRDDDIRRIMERSQSLENRGAEIVNNMPRTHAG